MSKTSLSFFVPGQPIAQPRHRVSGKHRYIAPLKDGRPHPIHAWKELIALTAKQQEWEIVKKGRRVSIKLFFWMMPPKKKNPYIHTVKPDFDNLTKAVTDAIEGIIYENDSQIDEAYIQKMYNDNFDEANIGVEIIIKRY